MKKLFAFALIAQILTNMAASPTSAEVIPLDDPRWEINGQEFRIEEHMGQKSFYLKRAQALLADTEFRNGIIEYDIAFPLERGFHAVQWRIQEGNNFEEFYLRPQQSGKADANQYTPVLTGLAGWQLYFGPQFSAPTVYRADQWNHVKIVVNEQRADIYVNSDKPVLHIPKLKRAVTSGGISLTANGPTAVHYTNISITPMDDPAIIGTPPEPEVMVENTVTNWSISDVFEETSLDGKTMLDNSDTEGLSWQSLAVEGRGYANIARLATRLPRPADSADAAPPASAVFARTIIDADKAEIRKISFGYSDRVRVYLNGRLLYSGDNGYRTRDFRYLGTIGLFDELYLPLEAGENSLLFAVGESFGGWGIMAALDDTPVD